MKSLETTDPEKAKLTEASLRHRKELEKEVKAISKTAENAITNALFIAGALALTYFAFSQLTKGSRKKKKEKKASEGEENVVMAKDAEPTFLSHVGEIILTQATMAILELAKERLSAYLEKRKDEDS